MALSHRDSSDALAAAAVTCKLCSGLVVLPAQHTSRRGISFCSWSCCYAGPSRLQPQPWLLRSCMSAQVSEKRSEAEREGRKRERLEKESRDLRAQVDAKNDEVGAVAALQRDRGGCL